MKHSLMLFCVLLVYFGIAGGMARAEDSSVLVQESKVVQQPVSETLTVYGQVWADPDAVLTVSLSHAGLITHVAARLGQRVKRGQALFELAISPEAYKQYLEARSAVDYARRELNRQRQMFDGQLAVKAQVDAARKALEDARASLQSLTAQKQNKVLETVPSPTDGIVTQLALKQGDRVQGGTAALAIASGNRLIALLGVEPEDIHLLQPGTPVRISSVFVRGYKVESHLREIHAMINPATHLVDALVPIPEDQTDHLVLGSRLTAEIPLNTHAGLTVPRDAVLQDQQGSYVFRVVAGRAKRVEVTTGRASDKWIEIVNGLKPDDSVVSVGNYELTDGIRVREGR